jgi:predicted transcriptional regulator
VAEEISLLQVWFENIFISMSIPCFIFPSSLFGQQTSQNEELAMSLGLTAQDIEIIVNYPMEQFLNYLKGKRFSEEQTNILRNIRFNIKTKTRNEELAESLGLSVKDVEKIVNYPMAQFLNYVKGKRFSEEQTNILRDIR